MKNLILFLTLTLSLCIGNVEASCLKQNFEGTFINRRGDRFKIEQPTCDQIIFTDLQIDEEYEGSFKNPANQLSMGATTTAASGIIRIFSIVMSLDNSKWDLNETTITLQSKIKLKHSDLGVGLTAPTLVMSLSVLRWNESGDSSKKADQIWINMNSFKALEDPTASVLQKAFLKGINLGMAIVSRFVSPSFSESLIRENYSAFSQ